MLALALQWCPELQDPFLHILLGLYCLMQRDIRSPFPAGASADPAAQHGYATNDKKTARGALPPSHQLALLSL